MEVSFAEIAIKYKRQTQSLFFFSQENTVRLDFQI